MKRRTLLRSALALPLVTTLPASAAIGAVPPDTRWSRQALTTGLAGLDYSLGSLNPGSMSVFLGPASTGKTLLLLELAARLVERYQENVLFYSVQQPSLYTARKVALREDAQMSFANECTSQASGANSGRPAIYLLDAGDQAPQSACEIARRLQVVSPFGCAAVILDGWITTPVKSGVVESDAGIDERRVPRWPHTALSRDILLSARQSGVDSGIPVVLGVTTPSETDHWANADFAALEAISLSNLDRRVVLQRAAFGGGPLLQRDGCPNVVHLSGTSPQWWDTRYSKLRLDPGQLRFSTVL